MTTDFEGDSSTYEALITAPSDGELRSGASVQVPFEQSANRTSLRQRAAAMSFTGGMETTAAANQVVTNDMAGNGKFWVAAQDDAGFEQVTVANHAGWSWLRAGTLVSSADFNGASWDPVNELFIVCGTAAEIFTAPGSTPTGTWTNRATSSSVELLAIVTSSAGVSVAVGLHDASTDIAAERSTDGTSWSTVATMPASAGDQATGIATSGTTFVACGNTSGSAPLLWRSTDSGATFSAVSPPGGFTDAPVSITYDGSVFIVLGDDGAVMTSSDGSSWAVQTGPSFTAGTATHVRADSTTGHAIAISSTATDDMYYSVDSGVTWAPIPGTPRRRNSTGGTFAWMAVGFDGNSWALVGGDATDDVVYGAQGAVALL